MNPEDLFAGLKKLFASLTVAQKLSYALVIGGAVAVLGFSSYWITRTDFALLADGLSSESASAIVTKLKAQKVEYQITDEGRAIRVPVDRVNELRLLVASDGPLSSGHIGFELFDKTSFGTTDAQEKTNYQRALQGELERTISTLSEVANARVHLTMPKDSLFTSQSEPAKASVMLKLKSNRPLSDATVRGIAGLISNSVESMRPESVRILDTNGRVLAGADDVGPASSGPQLDKQLQIEKDLTTKVVALLEPVVGTGHVRVNVAARLKADAEEETEERWDPTTVVRSRQTNAEADARAASSQNNVSGARGNLPEGASAATPPPSPTPQMNGTSRNSETTNYEVSKLTRHKLSPQGQLSRLSVAVIVDDEHPPATPPATPPAPGSPAPAPVKGTPRKAEELQRIQKIVSAAVGFDQARGDQLTVENISFDSPADDTVATPTGWKQTMTDMGHQYGMSAFRTGAVLILALAAILGVLRPMSKRALVMQKEIAQAPSDRVRTIQEMEALPGGGTAPVSIPMDAAHRLPGLSRQVARLANDEPEQLARIVRGWLAEEEH